MMGALIAFALVFFMTTWLASAVLCAAMLRGRPWLRRRGPQAERRAASIALTMPVAIGVALTASLAGFSMLGPSFGFADHCLAHEHHLHLCLQHAAQWTTRWWAIALVAGVGGLLAARVARLLQHWWTVSGHLRDLRAVSSEHAMSDGTVVLRAPSRQPFCFTAGWSPRIYLGTALLDRLDDQQQAAVVAHERAHVAFGDLRRGKVLSICALAGAPGLAASALAAWRNAGERLCDRAAADAVRSPVTVASAILALARTSAPAIGCSFVPRRDQVADRIEAVLGNPATGKPTARRLGAVAATAFLGLAIAAVGLADPLHHAIETLLGSM
jgi:beta-lactamase regulating signal transducer with metallopeptidase domain